MPAKHSNTSLPPLPGFPGLVFKHVPGCLGYCVATNGTVWSCRGSGRVYYKPCWHLIRPRTDRKGYRLVVLRIDGQSKMFRVARLILVAFVGPCPKGMEAAHENGIANDDRIENLKWKTPNENNHDKERHGTVLYNERNPASKLKDCEVIVIRKSKQVGVSAAKIASIYGVDPETVRRIWLRTQRSHL